MDYVVTDTERYFLLAFIKINYTLRCLFIFQINFLFLFPLFAQELLANRPKKEIDTTSLFGFWVGAYACPKHILDELKSVFQHSIVSVAYGLTEAGLVTVHDMSSPEGLKMAKEKTSSVGKVQDGYQWKVCMF